MLPYYLLMKLPGEERASFLLMQPFTPRDRPNMVSFMVAKSGPLSEYGRLIEYSLPADRQVDGPGPVGWRARVVQHGVEVAFVVAGAGVLDSLVGMLEVVADLRTESDTGLGFVAGSFLRFTFFFLQPRQSSP